jgi:DNA-binding MarR family transcriptional regulator
MNDADPYAIRRSLVRKALAASRHRTAAGRMLGLSENEVLALQYLGLTGQLTPSALGGLLRLTSGGTTALVQRLERAGHISRESHPRDGRSTLLRLTPGAEARATEAFAPLVNELDRLVGDLSEDERSVVGTFLGRVAEAAERHAEDTARAVDARARAAIGEPVPGLWA